ncbi:hypothetical protein [Blastopirellula marina]|uniref:Gamma-glutamylcyclotransferase n=1 Tax=Blastopirellula marina TaxID=124 RepID=A0A2S8GC86_9BACT|nr:hypothetical protein [Blastopirellula marina]PQO41910.1 hypothetical protein C5Y98_02415 [Blastopirellula marina]PTL46268.1 hypothetical protein C5Y97_02415 [Blastopirellula marina]
MIFHRPFKLHLLDRIARVALPCPSSTAREHQYPWDFTELFPEPDSRISFVGYGSLINLISARRSFSDEIVSRARPVVVLGVKRVYEYVMSPRGRGIYGDDHREGGYGVLNARASQDPDDWFNGIEFQLDIEAFHALHIRESAYDLLPAWTVTWEEDHLEPHISYFLSCRRETFAGRQTIDSGILPHPRYHEVCEDGCRAVSNEFLDAFRASTWVRNTRMTEAIDAGDQPLPGEA